MGLHVRSWRSVQRSLALESALSNVSIDVMSQVDTPLQVKASKSMFI